MERRHKTETAGRHVNTRGIQHEEEEERGGGEREGSRQHSKVDLLPFFNRGWVGALPSSSSSVNMRQRRGEREQGECVWRGERKLCWSFSTGSSVTLWFTDSSLITLASTGPTLRPAEGSNTSRSWTTPRLDSVWCHPEEATGSGTGRLRGFKGFILTLLLLVPSTSCFKINYSTALRLKWRFTRKKPHILVKTQQKKAKVVNLREKKLRYSRKLSLIAGCWADGGWLLIFNM